MLDQENAFISSSSWSLCIGQVCSKMQTFLKIHSIFLFLGFPGGSVEKNLPANVEDAGSIPGLGRSPGKGNGNPLQYSCLGNPMDRRAW